MNFTVIWGEDAEQELAALWTASTSRDAVTRASHALDLRLARDPLAEGESRPGGRRITFEPPLAVSFHVDRAAGTVYVLHVWSFA